MPYCYSISIIILIIFHVIMFILINEPNFTIILFIDFNNYIGNYLITN